MRSRIVACASALLLGAALCTSAVAQESAAEKKQEQRADAMAKQNSGKEPHMAAGLEHLRQAEEEFEKANNEHGGHRAKALQLTKQARCGEGLTLPCPSKPRWALTIVGCLRNYRQLATYETAIRGFAICEASP